MDFYDFYVFEVFVFANGVRHRRRYILHMAAGLAMLSRIVPLYLFYYQQQ